MTKREMRKEMREMLLRNARDCTYYVASGEYHARDFSERHGISPEEARGLLAQEALKITQYIEKELNK